MNDPAPKNVGPEVAKMGGRAGVRGGSQGESSGSDIPLAAEKERAGNNAPPGSPLNPSPPVGDVTFVEASPSATPAKERHSSISPNQGNLQPGDVLGGRYEIWSVLGEGGMGTGYKALDREADHLVALNLIRTEIANNAVILTHIKQELLIARQVPHRTVSRIRYLT